MGDENDTVPGRKQLLQEPSPFLRVDGCFAATETGLGRGQMAAARPSPPSFQSFSFTHDFIKATGPLIPTALFSVSQRAC